MKPSRSIVATSLLTVIFLSQVACGSNFATELRIILAASGPLIQSLPLPANIKTGLISDFTELGGAGATFADDLKTCATSKPCKLNAVSKFELVFERVIARGRFGTSPKLQTIEGIIKGIIASARIFYGGGTTVSMDGIPQPPVTEKTMKKQVELLKAAMQP